MPGENFRSDQNENTLKVLYKLPHIWYVNDECILKSLSTLMSPF